MDGVSHTLSGMSSSVTIPHLQSPQNHQPTTPNMAQNTGNVMMATTPATGINAAPAMASPVKPSVASSLPVATSSPVPHPQGTPTYRPQAEPSNMSKVLDKRRVQELVKEVDPLEQLDDEVEDMLMQIADDFIDNVVSASCQLAKHRKSNTVEVKDVQLHLERCWNIMIPGFGSEDLRPYRKSATTEAHKQRLALIKKTLKKY